MQHKEIKLCAVLLLGLGLTGLQAQESVNATGGNASGGGGTVAYSVGQVEYTTNTETNGSVAQGVQLPYDISVVTGLKVAKGINLSVSAYPNPATDYLTLEIDGDVQEIVRKQYIASLFNMQGKLLQSKKVTRNKTNLVMGNLAPATYLVKVVVKTQGIASQQEVKTFKIIKTQ